MPNGCMKLLKTLPRSSPPQFADRFPQIDPRPVEFMISMPPQNVVFFNSVEISHLVHFLSDIELSIIH